MLGRPEPQVLVNIIPISTFSFLWNKKIIREKVKRNQLQNEISAINGSE
jgi:hypothetical protein